MTPLLYIIVPCYNDEYILKITAPLFLEKIEELVGCGKISPLSRILFVDNGSTDSTWQTICGISDDYYSIEGIRLSKNVSKQTALFAGIDKAKKYADVFVVTESDLESDINAVDRMLEAYFEGNEIVYAVENKVDNEMFIKKTIRNAKKKTFDLIGLNANADSTDYCLFSKNVVNEIEKYDESDINFSTLLMYSGLKSTYILYGKHKNFNVADKKEKSIRFNNLKEIPNVSFKPIHIISLSGILLFILSMIKFVVDLIVYNGNNIFNDLVFIVLSFQVIFIAVIGEYIIKLIIEIKHRPKYTVLESTKETQK